MVEKLADVIARFGKRHWSGAGKGDLQPQIGALRFCRFVILLAISS